MSAKILIYFFSALLFCLFGTTAWAERAQCIDDVETSDRSISERVFGNENSCLRGKGLSPEAGISASQAQSYLDGCKFRRVSNPALMANIDMKNIQIDSFFQDLASRSEAQLGCRISTLDFYFANPQAKQNLNAKASEKYEAVRGRLEGLVRMSKEAKADSASAQAIICELHEVACQNLKSRARQKYNNIEANVLREVLKLPFGYEPDVANAIINMADKGRFDADEYAQALYQVDTKYRDLQKFYIDRKSAITKDAKGRTFAHYCISRDFKEFAVTSGVTDELLSSYPADILSARSRAIIQCRINSKYKVAPGRLNTAMSAAFIVGGGVAAALTAIPSGGTSLGVYASAVGIGLSAVSFGNQMLVAQKACTDSSFVVSSENQCNPEQNFAKAMNEATLTNCLVQSGLAAVEAIPVAALGNVMRVEKLAGEAALDQAAGIGTRLAQSNRVRFFNKGVETPITAETFTPGKSYTVVIRKNKLIIGEDYEGPDGGRRASHITLNRDVGGSMDDYRSRGGSIRVHRDGHIEVSGFHLGEESNLAANRIADILREALPGVVLDVKKGRLAK